MPDLCIPKCSHAVQLPFCISPGVCEEYITRAWEECDVELLEKVLLKQYPAETINFMLEKIWSTCYTKKELSNCHTYRDNREPTVKRPFSFYESRLHIVCQSEYACKLCNRSSIDLIIFLVAGCSLGVNCLNAYAQTPLHVAAQHGTVSHVEVLLFHGAQLNCMDVSRHRPLHIAALFDNVDIVVTLLVNGAHARLMNRDKSTPSAIATGRSQRLLCEVFQEISELLATMVGYTQQQCDDMYNYPCKYVDIRAIGTQLNAHESMLSEITGSE